VQRIQEYVELTSSRPLLRHDDNPEAASSPEWMK
jgi:hypothetical protein